MNKYQEALNTMCKRCANHFVCKGTGCQPRYDLKELVERATPKKPIKDEPSKILYVPTYVCPNCGGGFSGRLSVYCYHCGQKLDWSDEE